MMLTTGMLMAGKISVGVRSRMNGVSNNSSNAASCRLRDCWFEPTFHKHVGKLCNGIQIHTEGPGYDHEAFKPWRIQALAFKAIRRLHPDYPLWRDFAYEYEHGKLAIDVINGGPLLREWVDDTISEAARSGCAGYTG